METGGGFGWKILVMVALLTAGMGGALDAEATDCALEITDWEKYCCVEKVDEWSGTVKCTLTGDAKQENIDEDLETVWDVGDPFTNEAESESGDETELYLDLGLESGTTTGEYTANVKFKGYYKSVKKKNLVCEASNEVEVTVVKLDIKAENGTDNPDDGLCVNATKKFKAVVIPAVTGTYGWSTPSSKIALSDASSQTVTVNAGSNASTMVGAEDLKVGFTPAGSSAMCNETHALTVVEVNVTALHTTPYLPGTSNPADSTSMGDDFTVTYQICPYAYTVDMAALFIKDKDDNLVYNDGSLDTGGGPHDAVWSVAENSLRSVNSEKDPYKAEVGIEVNGTYAKDSKEMVVTESEVAVVAETSTTTGNPVQECMESRWITYTATASGFVSDSPSYNINFTFHYKKADGTTWDDTDWSFDLIEDNTVEASDVPDGDADHFFETPVSVTASDEYTHTATSPEITIKVYELWIDYFRDKDTGKDWKVVVGDEIEHKAIASEDCTNWNWDMQDGVPDKWNPSGGDAKEGSSMKIPYSDLSGAHNSWFGDTYGTVNVFCEDEEGNNHHFYSTSMDPVWANKKKAKVFFDPELNVDGGAPSTTKPPCWFVFWNETAAGDSTISYDSSAGMGVTTYYTVIEGGVTKIDSVDTPEVGPDAYGSNILGGNSTCDEGTFNGGSISGIDLFHIVVKHEMLHYSDLTDGVGSFDSDVDGLYNGMETDENGNTIWDPGETNPSDSNTHNLSCPSDDIDGEYRTYRAEVNEWNVDIGDYNNADWSKGPYAKQW